LALRTRIFTLALLALRCLQGFLLRCPLSLCLGIVTFLFRLGCDNLS
jgi:hypothetical protein